MENVRENVSGQLSEMSVVQGLVVQDKFLFWQNFPLNNFYFRLDNYLLGDTYSLTQKISQPSHTQSYSLETENYELARFSEMCV